MKKEKELESYYEIVNGCAKKGENLTIPNNDAMHAAYLITTLFKNASSEMYIFTGSLYEGVFGDEVLKQEAINFLRKPNTKLMIAYQKPVSKEEILNSEFVKNILSDTERKGNIEIFDASKAFSSITNHFSVMDKKAFRYELNHITREAIANFGDNKSAEDLSKIFQTIAQGSESVLAR